MRRLRVPQALQRWYRRHRFDVLAGGVVATIVAALGLGYLLHHAPTRASASQHLADEVNTHQRVALSDAEVEALNAPVHSPDHFNVERLDRTTIRRHLPRPGELTLPILYSDGYFDVTDVRHRVTDHDIDPIDVTDKTHSVVAGGPGEAMVAACCEVNEAPVTVALLDRAPAPPAAAWTESSEVDLDLTTGHLAFPTTGQLAAVVDMPKGEYRMRVSGRGAEELEHSRERFRIELWPRRGPAPLKILRVASER